MARILFTAVVADMRGKLAGSVFSKNRSGSYVRTKVTPVNPQTVYQLEARNRVTQLSQGWRALTDAQRVAWNAAVSSFQGTNIFGNTVSPSGLNLYVKLNSNLLEAAIAVITEPPLPQEVAAIESMVAAATAAIPDFSIAFLPKPVPADHSMVVRVTPQFSPGITFMKNKLRNLVVLAAATASPYNALALYNARFGALVAGQKIGVEVMLINTVSGQKSSPFRQVFIVGA